jgi:hypothetical protein
LGSYMIPEVDAVPTPAAATSGVEPSFSFLDRCRHQKMSRMQIIADPAAEATPMPALAPVERPLAEFWVVVDPGLLVLVKVARAVIVVNPVVTLVVVTYILDMRVVVADVVTVTVDVIVATRLTRRPICWSLSSTKS